MSDDTHCTVEIRGLVTCSPLLVPKILLEFDLRDIRVGCDPVTSFLRRAYPQQSQYSSVNLIKEPDAAVPRVLLAQEFNPTGQDALFILWDSSDAIFMFQTSSEVGGRGSR